MRKLFLVMMATGVILALFSSELKLLADVYLGKPRVHVIQKGESLSKLAQQYYGNADYWRELALVNMAPNPDLIWVGEEILIPDPETIVSLNRAKTISAVKDLVVQQEIALQNGTPGTTKPDAEPAPQITESQPQVQPHLQLKDQPAETTPTYSTETSDSGLSWIWWLAIILIVGGAAGYWWMRCRKNEVVYATPENRQQVNNRPERPKERVYPSARPNGPTSKENAGREMAVSE